MCRIQINEQSIYCIFEIPALPESDRSADYFSRTGVIAVREKPDKLTPDNIEVMV